jgi:hypothetical protein
MIKVMGLFAVIVMIGVYISHERIIAHFAFHPEKIIDTSKIETYGAEEVFITTSDGVTIHTLYFHAENAKKTVLTT